jgi:phosphate transport system substrate-binding protein
VIKNELKKFSKIALIVTSLLIVGIIAACGGSSSGADSSEILIDGSSTVFPISQAVAEEFRVDRPEVQIP